MKKTLSIILATSVAAFVGLGCKKADETKTEKEPAAKTAKADVKAPVKAPEATTPAKADPAAKIGKLTVDELAKHLESSAVLDANGDAFRKEHGKIPGATLLTSYADFNVAELPKEKDKKLVFYCSNMQCGASKAAAGKAIAAGYGDVNVLPAGLLGWKEAGQKTEAVQ